MSQKSKANDAHFTKAEEVWDVERLYDDLREAKERYFPGNKKILTPTEKCYIRALLLRKHPDEIDAQRGTRPNVTEEALSKRVYRYIEGMLQSKNGKSPKIRWDTVASLLEEAGYKKELPEPSIARDDDRSLWKQQLPPPSRNVQSSTIPTAQTGRPEVPAEFQALIADRTEGFVGREYVFKAIAEFQATQPNGYFIIEGDPGMGKTAIQAKYVQQTDCVAYFNVRSGSINRADQFLESVCTQLISRYHLPYSSLPTDATKDGKFFAKLLEQVSSQLGEEEKLAIVIDALDEVDLNSQDAGANILYLPELLPANVYFILTRRRGDLPFVVHAPQHLFDLMAYSDESLQDVQTYIQQRVSESARLREWLDSQGLSVKEFVTQLAEKSENNFMYLRYVLGDIERGFYANLRIESLPQGLEKYYEDHWRRMGMMDRQDKRTKIKIVYVFAQLREPVSRQTIVDFAHEESFTVQEVLDDWDPFLHKECINSQTRYTIYHSSFRDFLERKDIVQAVGETIIQDTNSAIVDDLTGGI